MKKEKRNIIIYLPHIGGTRPNRIPEYVGIELLENV